MLSRPLALPTGAVGWYPQNNYRTYICMYERTGKNIVVWHCDAVTMHVCASLQEVFDLPPAFRFWIARSLLRGSNKHRDDASASCIA